MDGRDDVMSEGAEDRGEELVIRGCGLRNAQAPTDPIDVGNAGTLMRLLPGWLAFQQGNSFMRTLLVESAQTVTRLDEGFRKQYLHRCHRMAKGVAKVAAARRLAVRLFWMLRTNTKYPEIVRIESSPTLAVVSES